jgi:hypothetical protein
MIEFSTFSAHYAQRTGLCDVGGFEIRLPGTAAPLKNKCTNKVQKMIEKLLPEPKPNSEPMLMGIASAPILQNPLLAAGLLPHETVSVQFLFIYFIAL